MSWPSVALLRLRQVGDAPLRKRLSEWLNICATVGLAQIAIQGVGFLAGILILRMLSASQYGLYTLAFAMQSTISVLADGGISSGAMVEGGKVWQEARRMGAIVVTALDLRHKFAVVVATFAAPVLVVLLHRHGASWAFAATLTLIVLINFWLVLDGTVYGIAPLLHQKISATQSIGIFQNLGRLAALAALLPLFPSSAVAISATVAAQGWSNFRLKRLTSGLADLSRPVDPEIRRAIFSVVKRLLPGVVYFSISGQVTIFLISIFGNTKNIAQVGALGRIAQVFTLMSLFTSTVMIPRFARLKAIRALILRRYLQVIVMLAIAGFGIVAIVALFPTEVLWILGREYSNLTHEVILLVVGSAISLLATTTFGLGRARGYIIHPGLSITLEALTQVLLALIVNLHTVQGILWMSIGMASFQLLMQATYLTYRIYSLPE